MLRCSTDRAWFSIVKMLRQNACLRKKELLIIRLIAVNKPLCFLLRKKQFFPAFLFPFLFPFPLPAAFP